MGGSAVGPDGPLAGLAVQQHASSLGAWWRVARDPHPALAGTVVRMGGFWQQMPSARPHRGISDGTLPLVLSFGPTTTLREDGAAGTQQERSFLGGPDDRVWMIEAATFAGVQVDLTPLGAHRLLGLPLEHLTGQVVGLDALLGAEGDRLVDRLGSAPHWPARFHLLEGWLRDRVARGPRPDPGVVHALDRLDASRGRVRVEALADELGWSPRRLHRGVRRTTGLAPKRLARLLRFRHAHEELQRPGGPDLATVAAWAGYADQAHFTREVKAFSGLTPTELLAARLPDGGGVFDPA